MLSVGLSSYVKKSEILSIHPYISAKLKTEVATRKKEATLGKTYLQDCTRNHVIKSVIVCKDGTYILSSVSPETLAKRIYKGSNGASER